MDSRRPHDPVLVREILEQFEPIKEGILMDATLGAGGTALALMQRPGNRCRLFGMDRDPVALRHATRTLESHASQVTIRQGCFDEVDQIFPELVVEPPVGYVFDLGVSSMQLDDPTRGFSFDRDGPLDMRMDPRDSLTAAEIVNRWSERDLEDLFRRYGEEPRARKVAEAIVTTRRLVPIRTTGALATLIGRVAVRRPGRHAATKCFMALRLAVNGELERLERGLTRALSLLARGGRIVVVSFHSLEDRLVKHRFRTAARGGRLRLLNAKPIVPTAAERRQNPRSRSARLRAAEACGPSPGVESGGA